MVLIHFLDQPYLKTSWFYVSAFVLIVYAIGTLIILHGGSGGMSSLQLRPPETFDFKCPDNWLKWRHHY